MKMSNFDLLFVYGDEKMRRLPFHFCRFLKPIGIFPFADDNRYIELSECENKKHTDKDVDEKRLLDVDFCMKVYAIKDQLNEHLEILEKPLLTGIYLADRNCMQGCGWLIGFDDNKFNTLSADYYGGNQTAKLRYQGVFEKETETRGLF